MASLVLASERQEEAMRRFRHVVGFSAIAHIIVVLVLGFWPTPKPSFPLINVVTVDLLTSMPGAPPVQARSAPKKMAPVKRKVVLPTTPEDPIPTKPAEPKVAVVPEKPEEKDYDDILEELRKQAGLEVPKVAVRSTDSEKRVGDAPTGPAGHGGSGIRVSPEVAAWLRQARVQVRQNWTIDPGHRYEPFETHVLVEIDANGFVQGEPTVVKGSGNPWFDDRVIHAVQKASPLPPPPEPGEWSFVFRPEDEY